MIRAASAKETRERLNAIASELSQISEDQDGLERLRGERNRILAPLLEKVEEARLAVAKVETSLYQTDVRKQNLFDLHIGLFNGLEDIRHIAAGIDNGSALAFLVKNEGAVLLEGGDGNNENFEFSHDGAA